MNLERERLNARAATSSAGGRASLRHCQAEGTLVAHAFLQRERMRPGNDRALTFPGIGAHPGKSSRRSCLLNNRTISDASKNCSKSSTDLIHYGSNKVV